MQLTARESSPRLTRALVLSDIGSLSKFGIPDSHCTPSDQFWNGKRTLLGVGLDIDSDFVLAVRFGQPPHTVNQHKH